MGLALPTGSATCWSSSSPGTSSGEVSQLGDVTERLKGVLPFSPAPENNPRIISKTVDISLYKEGSSFGFVLRGQCAWPWERGKGQTGSQCYCLFFFCLNECD